MKLKFMLSAVIAIAFAACTQEDTLTNESGAKVLNAVIENNSNNSRVGFTDGTAAFFWTQGDKIGVTTSQSQTFQGMTLSGNGGEATGTFTGNFNGDISGYAVYPYGESGRHSIDNHELTYTLPNSYTYSSLDQTYAKADGNSHNAPMWGSISNGNVAFKHLGGVIAFSVNNLPENTSGMQFVLTATNKISGTFTADLTVAEPKLETSTTNVNDEKKVTIQFSTASGQTSGYFYVPVPTGLLGNLSLVISHGEDEVATGAWDNISISRKDIRRTNIGSQSIIGGNGEIKQVESVGDVQAALTTQEDNLIVQVTEEVTGEENTITIPRTLDTNTTTFSFASVANDAKITIENEDGGAYDGQIIIEVPVGETIPEVEANIPHGEVYIKQGNVTTLVVASAENTTIIGAGVKVSTLTVLKGNVRIEDGGQVTTIAKDPDNSNPVYVIFEGEVPDTPNEDSEIIYISAGEWDLRKAIAEGGTVTLSEDVTLTSPIFVENTVTLNLNGKNITTSGESFYVQGVVSAAVCVKENGNLTVIGEGTIDSQNTQDYAVEVRGGELNIEGGKYVGCVTSAYAITGTINISGGEFTVCNDHAYDYAYVLNLLDANGKNGTASINVTGGKFYKFNPAVNASENPGKDYVQAGYSSVATDDYYVVSEGVKNELSLRKAIAEGGTVTLSEHITLTSPLFVENTVTLNLNGKNITTIGESFYVQGVVSAAICVKENGNLTVIGEGTIDSQNTQDYAVEVRGGELNIEGGKYVGCVTSAYALTGTINISGGEFTVCNDHAYDYAYVLNLLDGNGKNGTASINVTGGKFYKFNPAVNASENPGKDYVQAGYSSVAADDYYVVSEGTENE